MNKNNEKQRLNKHTVASKNRVKKKLKKIKKSLKKVLTIVKGCGTIYTLIRKKSASTLTIAYIKLKEVMI